MEIESHTLIKSGGGNRPYDARQPVSEELAKVLIPTDSYLDLADKGRKTCNRNPLLN